MAQMVDNHNQSLQTVERLMALAQNIKLAYRDADPSLKRFYLGLFWQKFLVRKGKIVDGILTDEVKDLIKKPEEPSVPKKSTSNFLYREHKRPPRKRWFFYALTEYDLALCAES
jgi:hypothetical protein